MPTEPGKETAAEILAMAEEVMARARPETAGLWPRAAALLARQALEQALDEFWRERGLIFEGCGTRPQLICSREYLGNGIAGRLHEAWTLLTRSCHHHHCESAPTIGELVDAATAVRWLSRTAESSK